MLKYIWILLITVSLDQLSKFWVLSHIAYHNTLELIQTKIFGLNLFLTYNTGIAFGLFHRANGWQNNLFSGLTMIAIMVMLYLFCKKITNNLSRICMLLIISGAIGNFIDRIVYKHVIDFIDLYIIINKQYFHWYTFNLADSSICLGTIILIYQELRGDLKCVIQ